MARPPRRWADIVPAIYFAGGVAVWIDFMRTNPDGLANLGLMLYVAPVTALGLLLGKLAGAEAFVLLPSGMGYLASHATYFFPSLILVTCVLRWGLRTWAKRAARPPRL